MNPTNLDLYRRYLALDGWMKRLSRAGVKINPYSGFSLEVAEQCRQNRHLFDTDVPPEQADRLVWADVRFALLPLFEEEDAAEKRWGLPAEEREALEQAARQRALFRVLDESPEARVVRKEGTTLIYGIAFGVTFRIDAGSALCTRVQTGTRTVSRPAEDAEMIEVEEPVFEWICNDAELAYIAGGR